MKLRASLSFWLAFTVLAVAIVLNVKWLVLGALWIFLAVMLCAMADAPHIE